MSENELNSSESNSSGYCSFQGSDDRIEVVDLSKNGLKKVPEDLLEQDFRRLNLSCNSLTDVTESFRMKFESLKELNLSRNRLSEFHKPACWESLKILDLSWNSLTLIPSWLYMNSKIKMDILDLSCNPLSSEYQLHYSLKSVASITHLNLCSTGLTSKSLCALKNMMGLKKLDISSYGKNSVKLCKANFLWDIDPADLPPNLEELIARDVGLNAIPDFSKLPLLRVLDLSENLLMSLYKDFPAMKNLEKLILEKCKLCLLPNNIGALSSLLHVNLSHNDIGMIPESFSSCQLLRHLDLYDNSLESLPSFLNDFISLETLDLANNYFKVPDVVCGTKEYATLEANLRSEIDEKRSNKIKVYVAEDSDPGSGSSSCCSSSWSEEEFENDGENDGVGSVKGEEEEEKEIWDDLSADDYVPCELSFHSDCYDSDDSLGAYIAQCPPEIKFSKNFFVPAASSRESKEVKMARRKAINNCFPPPVPGQFDDA